MGRAMLSKSLIQFSVDGWSCVPSLLFTWGPNYGGGNEDNGDLLQKGPRHALLHSVPPTLQQATADPRLHQRLLDTHGQVWVSLSWVPAPFSWVMVHTTFCLCPPRVYFLVLCKFWQLYVGLMATSSKQVPYPCLLHPEPLPLQQSTADPYLHRRHSNTVLT